MADLDGYLTQDDTPAPGSDRTLAVGFDIGDTLAEPRSLYSSVMSYCTCEVEAAPTGGFAGSFEWLIAQPDESVPSAPIKPGLLDPLGNGIERPFRRTVHADFAVASGVRLILSDIGQLLGTPIRRLPWRHDFGADLQPLRHKNNTDVLQEVARHRIETAIRKWAVNVELRSVRAERPTPNSLILWVTLVIGAKVHTIRVPL